MATMIKNDQFLYAGRGPIDAKSLVKTYAELTDINTWTEDVGGISTFVAYNGMLVAVWLNKEDTSKNGLYFLFDSSVTSAVKKPNVENVDNWHKLADMSGLADITGRLTSIESELEALDVRLTTIEEESDIITYGYRSGFPSEGEANKLYVAADEGKSYIWFNGDYLPVSGSESYEEPTIIHGGTAD